MKLKKSLFLILLMISVVSFAKEKPKKIKKNVEYTSESGLKYTFHKINNKGIMPLNGDHVEVEYVGQLTDGKEFDASRNMGAPFKFTLGKGQVIKGWDEGIALLHEGDSATFTIPANLAYGERGNGIIPGNSTLIFHVKLVKITPSVKPYNVTGLDTTKLENGLNYIVVKKGFGISAKKGNKVSVHYSGYLLDGSKFDASYDHPGSKPFDVILGKHMVIEGWEKGIIGMQEGEKRRLIIPYQMAYGENGRPPVIPAKADLIFDVELAKLEIIPQVLLFDTKGKDTITTESGLQYIKVKETNGRQTKAGDTVVIKYSGFFRDLEIFDSSYERNDSITFVAGIGQVIPGWDEALLLMKEGEKFRLIIPYTLGYGERGYPPIIPPKSDLLFDVYMVKNQ